MKKLLLTFILFIIGIHLSGRPAKPGPLIFSQPDGSTFTGRIIGDEFMRISTTAQGEAVIQEEDGWWCYAEYDPQGRKVSTGVRVGLSASPDILSASRQIPYSKLIAKAKERKARMPYKPALMTKSEGTVLKKHAIVILAEFSDVPFSNSKEDFINMLTKEGYSENGATGSAKEYFDKQFQGMADFEFTVSDIVTLSRKRSYYGKNANGEDGEDAAPAEMIVEACELAAENIRFSQFDDDNDGEVDNIFVFYAGGDEAEGAGEECIWAHAWYVYDGAGIEKTIDGKKINRYACASEMTRTYISADRFEDNMAGIGTFCHEYSHTFGLPDLYDTDYSGSGGFSAGLWTWTALMDGGNSNNNGNTPPYFNAIEREILGLSQPITISDDGTYTLPPIHTGTYYKIETDVEGEYYLLEYRDGKGWDEHIRGSGMLVYHIDKTTRESGFSDSYNKTLTASQRWNQYNEVNANPDYICADLLEADTRTDVFPDLNENYSMSRRYLSGIFFPYNDNNTISQTTNPALRFRSGNECPIAITDIKRNENDITFKVVGFNGAITPPNPTSLKVEILGDAANITFSSDREYEGNATVSYGRTGEEKTEVKVMSYAPGKWGMLLTDIEQGNKTYTVSVCFEANGLKSKTASWSFMTAKTQPVIWPYIYMTKTGRNGDGSFVQGTRIPLHVVNSRNAAQTTWTFDGKTITPGGDNCMEVKQSGTLKAYVKWESGETDVIEKQIIISGE